MINVDSRMSGQCWATLIVVGFCILAFSRSAVSQEMEAAEDPEWHFQFELFQMLLEENGLQSSNDLRTIFSHPEDSVLVLLGSLDGVVSPRSIETFCNQGGTVLMACDSEYSAGRLGEFEPGPVQTTQLMDQYQNFADCITITNLDDSHPLMEGIGSLVVNRSGWLAKPRWFLPVWDVVARLPQRCSPDTCSTEPLMVEVKVSETAKGRLIMAADQSLFTNGMLWHGDNAILAINLSKLLCEGEKSTLCFIADGVTLESYQQSPAANPSDQPPRLPENLPTPEGELDAMLRLGNSILKNVEQSNVIDEFLANRPRSLGVPYYKRSVLFVLIGLALLFVIWKLSAATNPLHAAMPHREMKSAHALAADRKIKSEEFGMAASMLARELCREVTGSDDSAVWQKELHASLATGTSSSLKKPKQKQIEDVVNLAVNTRTVHISQRRFQAIGQSIQDLRQLHQQNALFAET